jgi:hypothetical protein
MGRSLKKGTSGGQGWLVCVGALSTIEKKGGEKASKQAGEGMQMSAKESKRKQNVGQCGIRTHALSDQCLKLAP